jgi:threonine/homoserine/homoserine lactone efflux protein
MTWSEFLALLALATATSFTPGPNTTLSTTLAANGGLRRALPFVCAVPVGWSLLLALCAAGVGAVVLAVPALRLGILWGGVGYLLWLAWRLAGASTLARGESDTLAITFWRGVSLQFFEHQGLDARAVHRGGLERGHAHAWPRLWLVLAGDGVLCFFQQLTYALVGSVLRGWLAGPVVEGRPSGRRLRVFNRVMAAALVVTAVWMASSGMGGVAHATG